jgi:hypothetical protein
MNSDTVSTLLACLRFASHDDIISRTGLISSPGATIPP